MNVSNCRSCDERVVWLVTSKGKKMPVDAETVEPGDEQFDAKRHTSHFATCPNADEHRKEKKS